MEWLNNSMKYYYPLTISFSLKLDLKEQPLRQTNKYIFMPLKLQQKNPLVYIKCKRTIDRAHEI